MAFARVVTFEGVSKDRMQQLDSDTSSSGPPEGFPESAELIALHDPDGEKSLVIVIFDSEDDYRKGDEILSAMPGDQTPGRRTSVDKYEVAFRMKN